LSATVRCERETRSAGSGVDWRVTIAGEMTCDERSFYVNEEYSAYEAGDLVLTKTRSHTIPREWV